MMIAIFILALIPIAYIGIQIWQTITLFRYKDQLQAEPKDWPLISILVAARDEEANLPACLDALVHLDYPKDKLLIIIGNDQSVDQTEAIAISYAQKNPYIKVVNIVENGSGLKAKARVMAQMDQHAVGDFLLITDADVQVKPQWAKYLIRHMKPETGVASGTTMVSGASVYNKLQGIDWAYFMGLLNVISYNGVPATAVGNNMIVRKEAYWATGGYAAIKFSITEDYRLYNEVCNLGWKWDNIMIPEVLATSAPVEGFMTLLHQRKRWLSGGKELPWYWWILFGVFGLYYFVIPALLILSPIVGIVLVAVKFMLQCTQIDKIFRLVGEKPPKWHQHLLYEGYLFLVTITTALFFALPFKTMWKGRKY